MSEMILAVGGGLLQTATGVEGMQAHLPLVVTEQARFLPMQGDEMSADGARTATPVFFIATIARTTRIAHRINQTSNRRAEVELVGQSTHV